MPEGDGASWNGAKLDLLMGSSVFRSLKPWDIPSTGERGQSILMVVNLAENGRVGLAQLVRFIMVELIHPD
jgi:hypothetical protein